MNRNSEAALVELFFVVPVYMCGGTGGVICDVAFIGSKGDCRMFSRRSAVQMMHLGIYELMKLSACVVESLFSVFHKNYSDFLCSRIGSGSVIDLYFSNVLCSFFNSDTMYDFMSHCNECSYNTLHGRVTRDSSNLAMVLQISSDLAIVCGLFYRIKLFFPTGFVSNRKSVCTSRDVQHFLSVSSVAAVGISRIQTLTALLIYPSVIVFLTSQFRRAGIIQKRLRRHRWNYRQALSGHSCYLCKGSLFL